jgi:hypothetical protein
MAPAEATVARRTTKMRKRARIVLGPREAGFRERLRATARRAA